MDLQLGEGALEATRDGALVITPSFETVWPDVERRLRALLFRRGLDRASVDDVVQEVALRALANHVTYASATDLLRWAGPVACNLHVDLVRHRARMLDAPEADDHAAADDVPREVAHRIELQRAFRGIAALRPADREAIIEAVTSEPAPRTRKEAVRLAVRRHRARSRLAIVLEQLAAWVTGVQVLRRGRRLVAVAALVPAAAIPLIVTWHVPPAAGDARPARPVAEAAEAGRPAAAPATARATNARTMPPNATTAAAPRQAVRRPVRAKDTRKPSVVTHGPKGLRAEAGSDQRRADDHLICVRQWGVPVERVCAL
jgi:DNA-directed RNA polymerase specialized sigma24 family protein